jgi:galactokinase
VPVPGDWRFVVADTGVQAHKSGNAKEAYNRRRAAVEESVEIVGEKLGLADGDRTYTRLLSEHDTGELIAVAQQVLDERLLRRFRHVVTEAERTRRAEAAMRDDDPETFGVLMNGSHESLRDDFEVSGPELDRLVALARGAGALGARLTGAGMGGCIVALCAPDRADSVLEALRNGYFVKQSGDEAPEDLDQRLFVAIPSAGASVRRL